MEIFAKLTTDLLLESWFFFYALMPVIESSLGGSKISVTTTRLHRAHNGIKEKLMLKQGICC
jgi:hypothetical protein